MGSSFFRFKLPEVRLHALELPPLLQHLRRWFCGKLDLELLRSKWDQKVREDGVCIPAFWPSIGQLQTIVIISAHLELLVELAVVAANWVRTSGPQVSNDAVTEFIIVLLRTGRQFELLPVVAPTPAQHAVTEVVLAFELKRRFVHWILYRFIQMTPEPL